MSNPDIQAPEDASAETQEVLKELAAEGHEIAGQQPKETPTDKDQQAGSHDDKHEDKSKDPKPKDEKPVDTPPKDQQEQTPDKTERKPRESKFVPVGIHNEERHKRQEAEQRAAEAERRATDLQSKLDAHDHKPSDDTLDEVQKAAEQVAEKHNLDPDFVKDFAKTIVSIASKRAVLPRDISDQLAAFKAAQDEQNARNTEHQQEQGFDNEFNQVIKEFPDLAPHKEELKQRAFSEGYLNTPLRTIAVEYIHDNPVQGRKTAEGSGNGRAGSPEVLDYDNLTEEQFRNLSDKQLDEYQAYQENKQRRK